MYQKSKDLGNPLKSNFSNHFETCFFLLCVYSNISVYYITCSVEAQYDKIQCKHFYIRLLKKMYFAYIKIIVSTYSIIILP